MVNIEITFTDGTLTYSNTVDASSVEYARECVAEWLDGKTRMIFGDTIVNRRQVKHVKVYE